jgi:1-phosphofructokinase family hexose kinase
MILVTGLSPAWQQVLCFDSFTLGEVNRAREVHWCASGKVLNAARAIHCLGGPVQALTAIGGSPGEACRREFQRQDISARWVAAAAPTRICTTVLNASDQSATELVQEASAVSQEERDDFVAAYLQEVASAEFVVLIGSLPPGTADGFFRELMTRAPGKVLVDARGMELLETLAGRPFLIKPNRQELVRTLGQDLQRDEDLFAAMRELNQRGAEWVLITDGAKPAYASSGGLLYRLEAVQASVVNPIGCGDCMAGALAWAISQGREPLDALRYAIAAAADKVSRPLPGWIGRASVEALASQVLIRRL